MNTNQEKKALKNRLQSKNHREAFVSASVDQTIPFQIRALRSAKGRNWTQEELATRVGMKQERISACENPNYGKFNIRTLKQLAAAFDVGLIVRFAPFSELVEWEVNMSPESLEVPSFDQEHYFKEPQMHSTTADSTKYTAELPAPRTSADVFYLDDLRHRQEVLPPMRSVVL